MHARCYTQPFVVIGAILERDGKILLVQENDGPDKGKWNQPSGWLDLGEDPRSAREVFEETGFEIELTGIVGVYSLVRNDLVSITGCAHHPLKIIFRGKIIGGVLQAPNAEIAGVNFFSPEEIAALPLRDPDIIQEVADYFAGRNFPLDLIRHTIAMPPR